MLTPANANPAISAQHFRRNALIIAGLWFAVLASGLGVVYSTHLSRKLVNELNVARHQSSDLHVQWGQYLLEQSTWAAYNRVENVATDKLQMMVPPHQSIVIVKK